MPRTPIWTSIAAPWRPRSQRGHIRPATSCRPRRSCAARFGVNRHTVRRALAALAEEGLVQPRRGAGVFVTARPPTIRSAAACGSTRTSLAAGRTPSRRILRALKPGPPTRPRPRRWPCPGRAVHVVEGAVAGRWRSRWPCSGRSFPPPVPGVPRWLDGAADLDHRRAWPDCGVADYTRASTRLTAKRRAMPVQALHLQLPQGAPILRSSRSMSMRAGVPVEFGTDLVCRRPRHPDGRSGLTLSRPPLHDAVIHSSQFKQHEQPIMMPLALPPLRLTGAQSCATASCRRRSVSAWPTAGCPGAAARGGPVRVPDPARASSTCTATGSNVTCSPGPRRRSRWWPALPSFDREAAAHGVTTAYLAQGWSWEGGPAARTRPRRCWRRWTPIGRAR